VSLDEQGSARHVNNSKTTHDCIDSVSLLLHFLDNAFLMHLFFFRTTVTFFCIKSLNQTPHIHGFEGIS
jgi:hypothetical protein